MKKFRLKYKEELTREAVVPAENLEEAKEKLGGPDVIADTAIDGECYYYEAEEVENWEE